jgi:hypothetical protein
MTQHFVFVYDRSVVRAWSRARIESFRCAIHRGTSRPAALTTGVGTLRDPQRRRSRV